MSRPDLQLVLKKWDVATYPRHHVLVREGEYSPYLYYLAMGAVRTYYHKLDKEVTEWLALEGTFFTSSLGFYRNLPSRLAIAFLEPSKVFLLHRDQMEALCSHAHGIERLFRKLLIEHLLVTQQRVDSFHFETAQQRYEHLLEQNPSIIQRIPLSYIASFLGMTQETLSRIRNVR